MKKMNMFLLTGIFVVILTISGNVGAATVFEDDFSSGLTNWTTGTNSIKNPGGATVGVASGRVNYYQQYDFIETKASYSGDFEIQFEVERTTGSVGCMDFIVEFVTEPEHSGILRLRYGTTDKYQINIGQAPTLTTSDYGNCVDDPELYHLQEMATSGIPYIGVATLSCKDDSVKFSFEHATLGKIETPWVDTGDIGSTTIRIWAMGSDDQGAATRFVDNVRVEAPIESGGLLIDASGALKIGEGGGTPLFVLGNIACTGSLFEGSSRSLKSNISAVGPVEALSALSALEAVQFTYKADPTGERHLGFIAEDVPGLVATRSRKNLRSMDIIAILTSVVQQQQKEIELLKQAIQ